jgi:hypothetical protein
VAIGFELIFEEKKKHPSHRVEAVAMNRPGWCKAVGGRTSAAGDSEHEGAIYFSQ